MRGNLNQKLLVVSAFLMITLAARAYLSVPAVAPARQPLAGFPQQIQDWRMTDESRAEDDVEDVLKADDYILRRYQNGACGRSVRGVLPGAKSGREHALTQELPSRVRLGAVGE
ncbi:MAG: exosortase-associated EpsI family protein [Acidobacteriales bacterium]|nr:exosortase-associated EpsI family protein [Terriglobales bacterium]